MAVKGMFNVTSAGFKYGRTRFATRANRMASPAEATHDGDTISVSSPDNFGVRFLGIDTAEISYLFPGGKGFRSLKNELWTEFFTGPDLEKKLSVLSKPLYNYLREKIGDGTDVGQNQYRHADNGRKLLQSEVKNDFALTGQKGEYFYFFQVYAFEFLDSYGRLLCFLRPHRDNYEGETIPTTEKDYNQRQLENGSAAPYFIFPNVNPFLGFSNPFGTDIIRPERFWKIVERATKLNEARQAVAQAREQGLGIFNPADPLRLLPMELRSVARGSRPNRYVIDLSQPGDDTLLDPELYFTIPNVEDRMYIPDFYGEYFQLAGWNLLRAETYHRLTHKS